MERKDYSKEAEPTNAMFRWIIFIVISMAAKVLNKTEIMNIYTAVGKSCGHSAEVDLFHGELIGMINKGGKPNEDSDH